MDDLNAKKFYLVIEGLPRGAGGVQGGNGGGGSSGGAKRPKR